MIRMSDREFDRAVHEAIHSIPPDLRQYLDNVMIEVRGRPSAAFCREYDVPDDLLGFYDGVPLEEKGADLAPAAIPDRIYIFKDNLCEMCESRAELVDEIRITVLHEIGHHFGLDEDRLTELGYE